MAAVAALLCGAPAPPPEPVLFAEGVVSTPDDEFGFALAPDGRTAFFGKSSPTTSGDPMQAICEVHRDAKGRWSGPEIAAFSGRYHDLGPAYQPDGSRLFFISDRPNGDPEKQEYNIWYVERTAAGWSEARALPAPVNSPAQKYGVSVSANGTLYFASNREGGTGSFDIYRSRLENGEYKAVENLGGPVNTKGPEIQPAIAPDESVLVFTALRRDDERIGIHKDYARGDLYVSFQENGRWSAARNCGPKINSGAEESWPGFSSDGRLLFFSSERGFATYRLPHRIAWDELRRGLTSTLNGMGNIYEVSSAILR
jgi:Tol biopolymer transport system component